MLRCHGADQLVADGQDLDQVATRPCQQVIERANPLSHVPEVCQSAAVFHVFQDVPLLTVRHGGVEGAVGRDERDADLQHRRVVARLERQVEHEGC